MSYKRIDYNNPLPEFEGLKFYVDAFNERRRIQQIMPIFYEEQPLTWKLYQDEITTFLMGKTKAKILDVGCGSGFWGLLLKKKFPHATVTCLDKNPVAIERTRYNALLNQLDVALVEGLYDKKLFKQNNFDLIVLTPPYHLYDPKDSEHIPFFARGGDYGLHEFYSQSMIAHEHLKSDGKILFNQMSAGLDMPDYVRFYYEKFKAGEMEYTNILPPISTQSFLVGLYDHLDSQYLIDFAKMLPMLFYTSGMYTKSKKPFSASENTPDKRQILSHLKENWQTRIELHKEINRF